jgi:hypothetical protein
MRVRREHSIHASILLAILLVLGLQIRGAKSQAADVDRRQTEILVAFTQNEWWLIRWSDNRPVCRVYTDHEGLPTPNEIQEYCGDTLYDDWQNTQPCNEINTENPELSECRGMYLHFIGSAPAERTLQVELPKARVWITLSNCDPVPLENRCQSLPYLQFIAEEPLPNEFILGVVGTVDGEPFTCGGDSCEIPLVPTNPEGILVEFWADSSYGDSSQQYQAQVRVVDTGVTVDPEETGWYVDVLSSQWLGDGVVASCAQAWQAFPPVGGVPAWLANPDDPTELSSAEPYAYLAGRLIVAGVVNASQCPAGGLQENGWANTCGVEQALPDVEAWQNSFNQQIVAAAGEARIPSQLLKNLFAQESQFWPGTVDDEIPEFGFGRMTELGADTVLLWNPEFYNQFCPLVLSETECAKGYSLLGAEEQAILRGALAVSADADCPTCETGIDLSYTGFSISLFAQTVQANCAQAGQIVQNASGVVPGNITRYEDLWRFTLVNYHAGPGCLSNAVNATFSANQGLTWLNVSSNLEPGCQTALIFVDKIAGPPVVETPLPTFVPPTVTLTPTPALSPVPSPTPGAPTPTPDLTQYPPPPTLAPTLPPTPYPTP